MSLNGAVVLLSGGIDSATALYWTMKQTPRVYSMNILYAQASFREANASSSLATAAKVKEHLTISLPFYKDIQSRYHPKQSSNITTAYVPARNTIFYGVATAYAEALEIDTIVFGSNADDTKELPDATPDFIQKMNDLLRIGTRAGTDGKPIRIVNPLINHRKIEVLKLAMELEVPLSMTWSCYEDVQIPCGKCRGCQNRLEAFKQLEMDDPLKYQQPN
ncbi:MAG TPA: 7-cyano-7-deazaguanine synthase [Candidatus Bathyarchaeia archaeon]|nr:7-cyano-7-deazaguanine synthase [Candidatus Bathyarchaeia archaeon]